MCNQWALKQMECGHLERDMAVVPCEAYRQLSMSAVPPAQQPPCPIRFHPGARPCITVDGRCGECRAKAAIDQQWQRASGSYSVDEHGRFLTYIAARLYLLSLAGSRVTWQHASAVQTDLVHWWIDRGIVINVDEMLAELGYEPEELGLEGSLFEGETIVGDSEGSEGE